MYYYEFVLQTLPTISLTLTFELTNVSKELKKKDPVKNLPELKNV